jgi:hypothetical protein
MAEASLIRRHGRQPELDFLRAFVVIGLFFFHTARVFDSGVFYIKNEPTSEIVDAILGCVVVWGMPLLFTISGMGAWHSLSSRKPHNFVVERVRRLLVPLVFGVLVVVPPQVWVRLKSQTDYSGTYWEFYRLWFDLELRLMEFPFVVQASPTTRLFETGHLWFLALLFAFTLLLFPIFLWLRGPTGRSLIDRVSE